MLATHGVRCGQLGLLDPTTAVVSENVRRARIWSPFILLACPYHHHIAANGNRYPEIVVVRGPASSLADWRRAIDTGFHPNRLLFLIADSTDQLPDLLRSRRPVGEFAAYICRGTQCLAPVTDLTELVGRLEADNLNTTSGDPR